MVEKGRLVLEANRVSKKYQLGQMSVTALDEVSVQVHQGEFVALAGSSGSGKTTLLNLFGCLDLPSSGEVKVDGVSSLVDDDNFLSGLRATKLGFVFQNFNLFQVLTARENVEYPLLKQKVSKAERIERALMALEKVGLKGFADRRPNQLSGGQRQRVAIARALVHRPVIIIADEPTASLDKKVAVEILTLMRELNEREGATIVFSSHDPTALEFARRTVQMSDGRVVSDSAQGTSSF